jgi:hypothetical protein
MEDAMVDAQSSRFIVTDRAQKADYKSGHRPLQRRHVHQYPRATDALGNLVRCVLLPGQRFDTVGVAPLIEGIEFGALLGDEAFDSNNITADLSRRGAKIVISPHPRRAQPIAMGRRWRNGWSVRNPCRD